VSQSPRSPHDRTLPWRLGPASGFLRCASAPRLDRAQASTIVFRCGAHLYGVWCLANGSAWRRTGREPWPHHLEASAATANSPPCSPGRGCHLRRVLRPPLPAVEKNWRACLDSAERIPRRTSTCAVNPLSAVGTSAVVAEPFHATKLGEAPPSLSRI
jgi:hypothetical protein